MDTPSIFAPYIKESLESPNILAFPSAAATRERQVPATPTSYELDELEWGRRLTGPEVANGTLLEDSQPSQRYTDIAHSMSYPYMNRWRVVAVAIGFFTQGMLDSGIGALLPSIEQQYKVSYGMVSLVFVCQAIGFVTASAPAHWFVERFGRAKVLSACAAANAACFASLCAAPPFPVLLISFLIAGIGTGTILALNSVFIINLHNGTVNLSYMHGLYGIGGVIAPFIATLMVSNGVKWSLFYTIPLASIAIDTVLFNWTFNHYESDAATQGRRAGTEHPSSRGSAGDSVWKKAMKSRPTLLGAVFIFAYQGAEVCISGWMISFLIDYRDGDPAKVGYVTSGFWAGITISRFVLTRAMERIGARISVSVLTVVTAALQLLVWLVPNVVSNAVVVAVLGILLGPFVSCSMGVLTKLLPSELHVSGLGFVSSMGMTGGAGAPLMTGLLAQKLGTVVLNPVCIVLYVFMEAAWLSLPRVVKAHR